jgi:hypothetical protein
MLLNLLAPRAGLPEQNEINRLGCQTPLSAGVGAKGFSGAVANPSPSEDRRSQGNSTGDSQKRSSSPAAGMRTAGRKSSRRKKHTRRHLVVSHGHDGGGLHRPTRTNLYRAGP